MSIQTGSTVRHLIDPAEAGPVLRLVVTAAWRYLAELDGLEGSYLNDDPDAAGMLGLRGPEMSRRARALPVFATLAAYGREGYRALVEHGVGLARELAAVVEEAEDFELLVPPQLCVVSFRYRPTGHNEPQLDDLNTMLGAAVLRDGRVYMGTTVSGGHVAFKPAFVNWRTTSREIKTILPMLREQRDRRAARRHRRALPDLRTVHLA